MDFNLGRHIFKPLDTLHNPVPASPWDQKHLSLSHKLYVRGYKVKLFTTNLHNNV